MLFYTFLTFIMRNKLSSVTQYFLSYFTSKFQAINPADLFYKIPEPYRSYQSEILLRRFIIRKALFEIDESLPNFLLPEIRKEYNINSNLSLTELAPTLDELTILKAELDSFVDRPQYKYLELIMSKHPEREIESILTVSLLDARDVRDYINGVNLEKIYWKVIERRKIIDRLADGD